MRASASSRCGGRHTCADLMMQNAASVAASMGAQDRRKAALDQKNTKYICASDAEQNAETTLGTPKACTENTVQV